ncbi:Protein CBG27022 [Caenorhabditis briggsae]|uniref:Protein CBG27022 n=1 Tax=Caenorhabditis briggsae TaxID=6238 RepID=B6IM88_CAEBR|nr:Protein CBG27022 [Caenorhabditis briggsae]CAS01018.1 Protein CBG27022 [Caenorhabditis briggsae]
MPRVETEKHTEPSRKDPKNSAFESISLRLKYISPITYLRSINLVFIPIGIRFFSRHCMYKPQKSCEWELSWDQL